MLQGGLAAGPRRRPAAGARKDRLHELQEQRLSIQLQPGLPCLGMPHAGRRLLSASSGPRATRIRSADRGGLLRVRLELCVVESFFYEAVLPFIKENGLGAATARDRRDFPRRDHLCGGVQLHPDRLHQDHHGHPRTPTRSAPPCAWPARRLACPRGQGLGAADGERREEEQTRPWWKGKKRREAPPIDEVWEANADSPAPFFAWGAVYGAGQISKGVREIAEAFDLFVGRYLLLTTVGYVGIKFIHYKLWDPIPF